MTAWRPSKFKSVEELEKLIESYFLVVTDKEKDEIPDVEWLACYLDTTRKTLFEYEQKEEFSNTIKRAKEKIFFYKKQLALKWKMNPTVFIFDSKNNHWYVDKTEIDQNTNMNLNINLEEASDEELEKILNQ